MFPDITNNPNKMVGANMVIVVVLFIVAMVVGGGRDHEGIPVFVLGYLVLFLLNMVFLIRAIVLKDKVKRKIFFITSLALVLAAVPSLLFLIMATGGLC